MWRFVLAALAALATVLVASGCASVVGVDFDTFSVGLSSEGDAAQCVPHATLRCLCALSEGVQTCSESGRLSACECRDSGGVLGTASANPCGNGTVDDGEACDDGNLVANDGCNSLCVPDGRPLAVENCPGQPVEVAPGRAVRLELATFARGSNDASGSCGVMSQPDRVYAVRASKTGTLTISVSSDAPVAFSIRTTCAAPGTALSCDAVTAGAPVFRRIPVELGQTYFVVLEPQQASAQAAYSISFGGP